MKKLLFLAAAVLLIGFAGCNKDDGPKGSSLKLTINGETIDLSSANFYLSDESEEDIVSDESSATTHNYVELYATDADWTKETSKVTYEVYFYVYFPLTDEPGGTYDMSYDIVWDAASRYGYFGAYYGNTADLGWGDTYSWVGWDDTDADGSFTLTTDATDEDLVRLQVSGNMERWDYDTNADPTWTLDQTELDVPVSLDFQGSIIDITSSNARTTVVNHKGKKFVKLNN